MYSSAVPHPCFKTMMMTGVTMMISRDFLPSFLQKTFSRIQTLTWAVSQFLFKTMTMTGHCVTINDDIQGQPATAKRTSLAVLRFLLLHLGLCTLQQIYIGEHAQAFIQDCTREYIDIHHRGNVFSCPDESLRQLYT